MTIPAGCSESGPYDRGYRKIQMGSQFALPCISRAYRQVLAVFAYTGVSPPGSCIMHFCALDDAHVFLMEAKALPAIPSASERLRRCLRACILLSWVGLEDGLDYAVEGWGARGRTIKTLPTKLKVRMLAFLLPLAEPSLVDAEFTRLCEIRNRLAQPIGKEGSLPPTLSEADQTFQFCLRILRAINTYGIVSRSHESNGRFAHILAMTRDVPKLPSAKERKLLAVSAIGRKSGAH